MYEIHLTSVAVKDYNNIPRTHTDRINTAIDGLEQNPRPHGYKKLKNRNAYRIRVGDYRIIYEIKDSLLIILVVRIKHRKEVYKKSKN